MFEFFKGKEWEQTLCIVILKTLCTKGVVSLFIYSEYIESHHFSQYFVHLRVISTPPSVAIQEFEQGICVVRTFDTSNVEKRLVR